MALAVKTKDLVFHQERLAEIAAKKQAKKQAKTLCDSWQWRQKLFSDLTNKEKDDLLKAIALELGMIAPD
jgi:hypothetical protein